MKIGNIIFLFLFGITTSFGQSPASQDDRIYDIVQSISADRLENDITKLANFGTRHTLSDTLSDTRGIGAARRWIKSEFDKISKRCNACLDVKFQRGLVKKGESRRIPNDTWIVNVMAIKKGSKY